MNRQKKGFIRRAWDLFFLWLFAHFFAWLVAIAMSFFQKIRMSHNKGVAAKGKARIVDNPEFPEHDFFQAGRTFDCRIRHASVTYYDDAMNQVRGASIKFADSQYKSPFDMEMNTGTHSIFWTAWNFWQFVLQRNENQGIQYEEYYKREPRGLFGAQVSGKHRPSSFSRLEYHSKTPSGFIDTNGNRYYVKYRLIPFDKEIEEASVPEDRLDTIYNQRVEEDETMDVNYLVDEFVERVRQKKVKYRFQMQLHTPVEGEDDSVFNSFIPWEKPWMDVAEVEIDEPLSDDESTLMGFNIKHHPSSLPLLPASSVHDYNSISYMRTKVYPAYLMRKLKYKLKGLPGRATIRSRNSYKLQ